MLYTRDTEEDEARVAYYPAGYGKYGMIGGVVTGGEGKEGLEEHMERHVRLPEGWSEDVRECLREEPVRVEGRMDTHQGWEEEVAEVWPVEVARQRIGIGGGPTYSGTGSQCG